MITLEKLANELNVQKMDEIVGGREKKPHVTRTTVGGTSGKLGNTRTTDEEIDVSGFPN